MEISKRASLQIFLLFISALSLIFFILYGWPLFLLLFFPGIFMRNKPRDQVLDENHCMNCHAIIDPTWKYCPYCSNRI